MNNAYDKLMTGLLCVVVAVMVIGTITASYFLKEERENNNKSTVEWVNNVAKHPISAIKIELNNGESFTLTDANGKIYCTGITTLAFDETKKENHAGRE